ncbi:MAG: Gfo/Idh/MocA family oxidoreductase [Alphaproteobacteria bacterium]|nr:Gfo/Idh/MocA family oxidoreductase [Alphaproteobacteria bacterium]
MTATRIAMIGAGMIGRRHMQVLLGDPAYAVAAIADPTPAAEAFAKEKNIPWFADYQRMLDEAKPQGAIVATPNQHHVTAGLACIARRIPVLVEKPIADSVRAAVELVEAGKRADVPILVGHHRRHNPIMRAAAETIRGGGVGRVTAVVAMWLSHKPDDYYKVDWRRQPGGGTVLINGIHDIDCLRMMCGEIDGVQAFAANGVRGFAVEDAAAAAIRFASGALGTLAISDAVSTPWSWEWGSQENPFYPHEGRDSYMVTGTKGSLGVPSLEHWWHEPGQHWGDALTRRRVPVKPADAYIEQMANFAQVIAGAAKPVVSGEDGARTLAATMAITESAATGRPVAIDEFMRRG